MTTTRKTGVSQRKRAQSTTTAALLRKGARECKSPFRHNWDPVGPIANRRRTRTSFGTLVTFRCVHCGSFRFWILSRLTGELLSSWYAHSDQYRELLDLKLSVNEWRAAWMDELDKDLLEDMADPKVVPIKKTPAKKPAAAKRRSA